MTKGFWNVVISIMVIFIIFSCAGKTKIKHQEIPQPLVQTQEGVSVVVIEFGTTKHWSQMEIAIANMTEESIKIESQEIYLKNEKGYYLAPYTNYQIEEKIRKRTGKYVNPLTIGALGAALTAIILPSKHDREVALKTAAVLAGGAIGKEVAEQQGAKEDLEVKDDASLKDYTIPPGLKLGGYVYYPPVPKATGMKAMIRVNEQDRMFEINF